MPARETFINAVVTDFGVVVAGLIKSGCDYKEAQQIAATLVLAARVEALEFTLENALPTAGEGV